MLEDMLTHILITFYTIFEDMFLPCLKICLHNIWKMFTLYLKTYSHQVQKHAFKMPVVISTQVWKTLLYHVWRHFYTNSETCLLNENIMNYCFHIYIFDSTFTLFLMTCLNIIWSILILHLKTYSYNVCRPNWSHF